MLADTTRYESQGYRVLDSLPQDFLCARNEVAKLEGYLKIWDQLIIPHEQQGNLSTALQNCCVITGAESANLVHSNPFFSSKKDHEGQLVLVPSHSSRRIFRAIKAFNPIIQSCNQLLSTLSTQPETNGNVQTSNTEKEKEDAHAIVKQILTTEKEIAAPSVAKSNIADTTINQKKLANIKRMAEVVVIVSTRCLVYNERRTRSIMSYQPIIVGVNAFGVTALANTTAILEHDIGRKCTQNNGEKLVVESASVYAFGVLPLLNRSLMCRTTQFLPLINDQPIWRVSDEEIANKELCSVDVRDEMVISRNSLSLRIVELRRRGILRLEEWDHDVCHINALSTCIRPFIPVITLATLIASYVGNVSFAYIRVCEISSSRTHFRLITDLDEIEQLHKEKEQKYILTE